MKRFLRIFLINILAVYIASQLASGMEFQHYAEGVVIAGLSLAVASYTIKPIVKILLLPLTLATMGIFRFLANVIVLYIVDVGLDQFKITRFSYPGLKSTYLDLPKLEYEGIIAYIAFAVTLSVIITGINWIRK